MNACSKCNKKEPKWVTVRVRVHPDMLKQMRDRKIRSSDWSSLSEYIRYLIADDLGLQPSTGDDCYHFFGTLSNPWVYNRSYRHRKTCTRCEFDFLVDLMKAEMEKYKDKEHGNEI
jgi:hypothetical protein